ncbi:class I SAM-dependent methyltransferase [Methanococcoides orientis]|uniref:class I SAM-dependent methyltransferase n=1 Tax=Methanococcoides orientis TaxID=2822137 RepID=UPI001E372639|nr:class I SAM-dependent methyltransferase [Methanococcoides orientis]UGV41714.1 class I SAM-dependent methyltransferase [Methanococcoides orientis]
MNIRYNRVCPAAISGILDNRIRRWFQKPREILEPYVKEGMTVLDLGCGPGFFSTEIARMVGSSGLVIASDLQEEMLHKLRKKIQGTELEGRIVLHKCKEDVIGISEKVDLAIAFYMLHEVPNPEKTLNELASIVKGNGFLFIAEPYLHVSPKSFNKTIKIALNNGFTIVERPKVFLSRAVVLKKD